MKYNIKTIEELAKYIYMKYTKNLYDPLDIQVEYIKKIINDTIDEMIENLFHLEKYKYRITLDIKGDALGKINLFIQNFSIDLKEIYSYCYEISAVPVIIERQKSFSKPSYMK